MLYCPRLGNFLTHVICRLPLNSYLKKHQAIRQEKYLREIYFKLCISDSLEQHTRIVFPVLTELAGVIPECTALPPWTMGLCCGSRRSEGSEAGCSTNEFILPVWLGVCQWRMKAWWSSTVRHEWSSDQIDSLFPEKRPQTSEGET